MFRFTIWNLLVAIYFARMVGVFVSHVIEARQANSKGREPSYFAFPDGR